ncbi:THxN family PEP-CTERM protein [Marinobacter sp.]|uniref:THxN family PEP-CTERM protein n=1 Tax=Marinobacter sp. TaxID=50741 RepID=UPI0035C6AE5D
MKHSALKLIVCSYALFTGLAMATPIEITDVSGSWMDAVPGGPVISGEGTNTIKWGNSHPDYASGYAFNGSAAPAFSVHEGEEFVLGAFTHFNRPIGGQPLTSAELVVNTMIKVNGVAQLLESIFHFDHWETVNAPAPGRACANGESREASINRYGCADRVMISLSGSNSVAYAVGPKQYYLDITGFFHDGELTQELWTKERATNTSLLSGIIRSKVLEVPEPSSLALVALSLLGLFSRKALKKRWH